jgi:magnesium transporter
MVKYYFRTLKDESIKEIDTIRNGVWVHVENPTGAELQTLSQDLPLDKTIIEDARDLFEVPRLEKVDGVTYFFTRYPFSEGAEDVDTAPILIAVGETFVLSISPRPIPQFQNIINSKINAFTTQKTKLFIQMMSLVTQSFEKQLIILRRLVHKDRIQLKKIGNQEIVRLVNYEHKLNDMVSAVLPTNVALKQVMFGNYMQVFAADKEQLDDLRIDNEQIIDSARSLLKTIQNVRNASEAILANSLNNRIKTLTVLTILLTIPTIISSLYGMNVPLPYADNQFSFLMVVALVVAVVSLVLWYFKRHDWL